MPRRVYVHICDSGWIIETMACKLAEALTDVSYGLDEAPECDLVYHLPYLTRRRDSSRRAIGYFTHKENDEVRSRHFFAAARAFEVRVCQSNRIAGVLHAEGFTNTTVISPGVDLNTFAPELRVGVVGRTYDSGRKGEQLIRAVMDIPGIRWCFTGAGWPGDCRVVPIAELPAFYNSVDYVLVASTNEGGPMCVLEALACGKEVIAPDVGWVNEFPHIPYEVGNVALLRAVLTGLLEKRLLLRRSVESRTWDAWIRGHEELFRSLLSKPGERG